MIAIDLGSSSLRCIHFDCESLRIVSEFEAIVKTAEDIEKTQMIAKSAQDRIIKALLEAKKTLPFESNDVMALTTEAMRRAKNSAEVINTIFEKTGIKFTVINAQDEAIYTALGVSHRLETLKVNNDNYVLFDLGGGSTEIIFVQDKLVESKSFNIGIVTTASTCANADEIDTYLALEFEKIQTYVQSLHVKPQRLVATAGTPTTMAAFLQNMNYANYDSSKINGFILSEKKIDKALEGLLALSESERAFHVGVGREELIIAGIYIVKRLYRLLGFSEAMVIDDGLREGVALKVCKRI